MTTITSRRIAVALAAAIWFAALADGPAPALAQGLGPAERASLRRMPHRTGVRPRRPAWPILATVALREQRIIVYGSDGTRMLDSPVSSGADGYETPPGIFSVVQKEPEHHSNLYDDASMPFMQRLTWTGIALHAGVLPGYPASHGCVRLPEDFADRLYDLTKVGMRVVIQREAIAPVATAEPALFVRPDGKGHGAEAAELPSPGDLEIRLSAMEGTAEDAAERVKEERAAAARARSAAEAAERVERQAETNIARMEADLAAAEKLIEAGGPPRRVADARSLQVAVPQRIEAARVQLEKLRAETQLKREATRQAEAAVAAAVAAHAKAVGDIADARQRSAPVSVFVSRKTQRIYVRKGFEPVWEGPIFIRDVHTPIGTFVFTANEPAEGEQSLAWSVLAMYRNPTSIEPPATRSKSDRKATAASPPPTDASAASAALARLDITPQMVSVISDTVLPGSSLIISDEPPNLETGKDTDFVVIMSGEPQGGIAIRQHAKPEPKFAEDEDGGRGARRPARNGGGFGWFD